MSTTRLSCVGLLAGLGVMVGACHPDNGSSNRPDLGDGTDEDAAPTPAVDVPADRGVDATDDGITRDQRDSEAEASVDAAASDGADTRSPDTVDVAHDAVDAPYVDPLHGMVGCPDGGFPAGAAPCALSMPVSGGVNTLNGDYCSNSGNTSVLYYRTNGINPELTITLTPPITRGDLGSDFAAVIALALEPTSGPWVTWTTPPGACRVRLDSNVCWFYGGDTYYLVSGRGSCSQPAVAPPADAAKPVVIGDFSFSYALYP